MYNTKGASTDGERREIKIVNPKPHKPPTYFPDIDEQNPTRRKTQTNPENPIRKIPGNNRANKTIPRKRIRSD